MESRNSISLSRLELQKVIPRWIFYAEYDYITMENTSHTPNTNMLRKSGRNQYEPLYFCYCCPFLWKSLYILEEHYAYLKLLLMSTMGGSIAGMN